MASAVTENQQGIPSLDPVIVNALRNDMFLDIVTVASTAVDVLEEAKRVKEFQEQYDLLEDFIWFTSGELNTESFKGLYIAIWKKQVVASSESAVDAERIAKAYFGESCRPAVVFIPENPEAIL